MQLKNKASSFDLDRKLYNFEKILDNIQSSTI